MPRVSSRSGAVSDCAVWAPGGMQDSRGSGCALERSRRGAGFCPGHSPRTSGATRPNGDKARGGRIEMGSSGRRVRRTRPVARADGAPTSSRSRLCRGAAAPRRPHLIGPVSTPAPKLNHRHPLGEFRLYHGEGSLADVRGRCSRQRARAEGRNSSFLSTGPAPRRRASETEIVKHDDPACASSFGSSISGFSVAPARRENSCGKRSRNSGFKRNDVHQLAHADASGVSLGGARTLAAVGRAAPPGDLKRIVLRGKKPRSFRGILCKISY